MAAYADFLLISMWLLVPVHKAVVTVIKQLLLSYSCYCHKAVVT